MGDRKRSKTPEILNIKDEIKALESERDVLLVTFRFNAKLNTPDAEKMNEMSKKIIEIAENISDKELKIKELQEAKKD